MDGTLAQKISRTMMNAAAVLLLMTAAGHACAAAPFSEAPSVQPAAETSTLVRDVAGRNLARIVLSDLALQLPPRQRDHQLVATVLGISQELMNDESVIRWRLAAASAADDRALSIELCRDLLRRDAKDEVIQYRLISMLLEDATTAEDRLRRINRFFTQGTGLSPVVLSRLALDGAVLAQQIGDDAGFVDMLKRATALDSTNRDAAAAAAAYFAERIDDPIGRLELLANLLLAEPTDPETQVSIGRELAALGAFAEARRFQENVTRMLETARIPESSQLAREKLFTKWGIEGPQVVVNALNNQIEGFRIQARAQREQAEKALLPTEGMPKPEEVRLEVLTERLRLVAAVSSGDSKTADISAQDLRASTAARLFELSDPKLRPQDISPERAAELSRLLKLGVLEALCWANTYAQPRIATIDGTDSTVAPDAAKNFTSALEELEDLAGTDHYTEEDLDYRVTRGWCLLRAGRVEEAIADFQFVGDQRAGAMIGLSEAYSLQNQPEKAMEACRLVWRSMPMSLEGMYVYSMMRKLTGREEVDADVVRRARVFAAGIPSWIDLIGEGGHRFMTLEVDVDPARTNGLDRTAMKIRLRNISPVPLGVGNDRALNSQLLLGSSMEVGISNVRAFLSPEVTNVGRRYRLMPNEYIEFTYWPEGGSAGWVTDECCDRLVRQRWRVVQGYSQAEDGVISTGPLCLSRESNAQTRSPIPAAVYSNAELVHQLATAAEGDLPGIVSVIRARLLNPMDDRVTKGTLVVPKEQVEAFASAAATRFASLSADARLLLCTVLPSDVICPGMKALDDAARADTDPTVMAVVILTRVTEAGDPLLAAGKASENARLSQIASILEERHAEGVAGFADRGGPDVRGIMDDSRISTPQDLFRAPGGSR